jgi:hypothetical protein
MKSFAAALALLAAAGCGKLDKVDITRSASETIPGVAVPAGTPSGSISGFGAVDIGGQDALRANGINPNEIDSAHLLRLRLEVKSGAGLETWLDSIAIDVEATGLARQRVASKSAIRALPANTTAVDLDVDPNVDLKPYLTAASAPLMITASGLPPAVDTTVEVTATIQVDVNVSGLL